MARLNLKQRARAFWQKPSHLNARPDQIVFGFSIGIFSSFLPLSPSPIIVATVVAWLLKRNVVSAVAGATAAILYTPLLPLIWLAEYRLGTLILPVQHPLVLDQARLWVVLQKGWDVYAAMLVGSIIIATPVSLLIGSSNGSPRDGLGTKTRCSIQRNYRFGSSHCQQVRRQPCPATARAAR